MADVTIYLQKLDLSLGCSNQIFTSISWRGEVMIDDERKIIMIHIPKTAGSSLKVALFPGDRPTVHELASDFPKEKWEAYFSFAFVRHPYQRLASQYVYHCKSRYSGSYLTAFPDLKDYSFKRYLKELARPRHHGFWSQKEFVIHQESSKAIDYIGRFESLYSDVNRLLEILEVETSFQRVNIGVMTDYSDLLTNDICATIHEIYREDFDYFGYEP